jgi:hypothetical protein
MRATYNELLNETQTRPFSPDPSLLLFAPRCGFVALFSGEHAALSPLLLPSIACQCCELSVNTHCCLWLLLRIEGKICSFLKFDPALFSLLSALKKDRYRVCVMGDDVVVAIPPCCAVCIRQGPRMLHYSTSSS